MWLLCSFQGPSRGAERRSPVTGVDAASGAPTSPTTDAGLSKLNSMLVFVYTPLALVPSRTGIEDESGADESGSVDVLGPIPRRHRADSHGSRGDPSACATAGTGAPLGAP
jgi:hypothetical protein